MKMVKRSADCGRPFLLPVGDEDPVARSACWAAQVAGNPLASDIQRRLADVIAGFWCDERIGEAAMCNVRSGELA